MHPQAKPGEQPNWYALLGVAATASSQQISAAVERLSRQATALSVTAPERSRLLRDQIRAIKHDLLSSAARRQHYDQALAGPAAGAPGQPLGPPPAGSPNPPPASPPPASPAPYRPAPYDPAVHGPAGHGPAGRGPAAAASGPGLMSRVAKFLQTGWVCTTCGHGALPGDKFCQKCGSEIQAPGPTQKAVKPTASQRPSAFCGKCGGKIAPGNTFCTQCGAQRA